MTNITTAGKSRLSLAIAITPRSVSIVALILATFVADTITNFEIALAVFYVVPILVSTRTVGRRALVMLAATCILLALISFVLTDGGAWRAGITNLAISIIAIGVTTYLALKMRDAEAAVADAQHQLMRVSRVSNLGELASSIAHEINQPVGAIATSAGACRRWLQSEPPALDRALGSLNQIADDARRAGEIVTRVRRLSQNHRMTREPVDLNRVVQDCVAFVKRHLDTLGVHLILALEDELPAIRADKIQLQQLVSNLLSNACDALSSTPMDRRVIEIMTRSTGADVQLRVSDNGIGISSEHLPHIFNALWTSKDEGTGLGLTIAHTITELFGGKIRAERPATGIGADLWVTFPIGKAKR